MKESNMTPKKLKEIKIRSENAKTAWSNMPLCPEEGESFWFADKLIYEDVPALLKEIDNLNKKINGKRKD